MTDTELLQTFVKTGEQEAFAELVRRHVDVVYAAARRQAGGNAELAEDITQRVFILLSQKAATLSDDVLLGGWLFNTVRFVARAEVRKAQRRTNQEKKAAAMAEEIRKAQAPAKPPAWDDAEGVLDDAMTKLDQQSRGVLVLRYFEGKSAREVGDRLGISEEAARKRTSRAVDQLRDLFARRGVMLSADQIAQGLALPLIHAPAHVAASATLAATSSALATASTSTSFAKGAIAIMTYIKTQTAVVAIVGLILLGGAVVGGVKVIHSYLAPADVVQVVNVGPAEPTVVGPTMSGMVRGEDGKPVVGAKVFVATTKSPMFLPPVLSRGRRPSQLASSPITDANGKYTVTKPQPPYAVFVVADNGYAQASWRQIETGTDLTLHPWGSVEGTLKIGDAPVPHGGVSLWRIQEHGDPWEGLMDVESETKTDADGHYVFPKLPPGEVWLSFRPVPNHAASSQWRYVQVESGKTANVQIGGAGVPLTGHADVPAEIAQFVDWTNKPPHSTIGSFYRTDVSRDRPKHDPAETPEQYADVELRFGQTAAGKATDEARISSSFNFQPDGTFVIDDVRPGKYKIQIRNLQDVPGVNFSEDVAGGETEVVVPADAAAPVDIGAITLKAVEHRARPGQPAPDFTVTTIDGKPWKLADQKGKTVLLFFWATYRQNMGEDKFAAFADHWGANPNVSILGICLPDDENDKSKQMVKTIADKLNFHFPQCADGARLLQLYDSSWPDAILIGKDGNIVQKNLSDHVLETAMEKEMGN